MIKKNLKYIILTFVITILPIFVGLALWDKLPDVIATHFDMHNNPNGWSSKTFAVFGIPGILVATQGICIFAMSFDPKKKNISEIAFKVCLLIVPVCSLLCNLLCYSVALGKDINIGKIVCIFLGLVFIALGNYLPKVKSNYTFGVRCAWTLNDADNWNYTSRVAGYCFVFGGILMILCSVLNYLKLIFPIIILMVIIPYIASFIYYKKNKK